MTEYVILRKDPDATEEAGYVPWEVLPGPVSASSASRALSIAKVEEGTYVAVPFRSWKPLEVKVEQTTKITIG